MTPQAFKGMYNAIDGIASRREQNLKAFDPTDVQAEVMVFEVIEPEYITAVIFDKPLVRDAYAPCLGKRKAYLNRMMFASREYARTRQ